MPPKRLAKRAEAGVPVGLLDAYTEGPTTNQGMSDSDKFKEGYKKKGKAKVRQVVKKSEDDTEVVVEEVEEIGESWDDGVVESWDQIDVEEMPLPVKVKKELRKEEKKKRKEEEKAAKAKDDIPEPEGGSPSPAPPCVTESISSLVVAEIATGVVALALDEPAEDKDKVKADREAKKTAKAAQRAAAKHKKVEGGFDEVEAEKSALPPVTTVGGKEGFEKKPELTKAERRAKQEAQRAAKAAAVEQKEPRKISERERPRVSDEIKADDKKIEKKLAKTLKEQKVPARTQAQRLIPLFSHLHQYEREPGVTSGLPVVGSNVHPAVVQIGLQMSQGEVTGSSERCVALLTALRLLLDDSLPSLVAGPELYKEIDTIIKPNILFLKQCRPLSISMQNAIRYLKKELTVLAAGSLNIEEVKEAILEKIDNFISVNFALHPAAISETANKKLRSGDTVLTFSHSRLVERTLLDAAAAGKEVRVVIAEARSPGLPAQGSGRALATILVKAGLKVTYVLATALDTVLEEVNICLLGCEGVMANGCVLATVGTSQVALLAKSHNIPVLVCCETYKFTTRVQTDSFVYNELSAPEDLVGASKALEDWRATPSLSLLNLVYDLTPATLVDSIVTEISQVPPSSVPVILRLHNSYSEE